MNRNDEKSSSAIVFFNNIEKHFPTSTPEFDKTNGGYLPVVDTRIENISASSESKTYKITSTGKIGKRTRIVEKEFIVNWIPKNQFIIPSDMALFVDTTIQLTGSAHIDGKIGTNSSLPNSIVLDGGAKITGDIFVGPKSGNNVVSKPSWMTLNNHIISMSEK